MNPLKRLERDILIPMPLRGYRLVVKDLVTKVSFLPPLLLLGMGLLRWLSLLLPPMFYWVRPPHLLCQLYPITLPLIPSAPRGGRHTSYTLRLGIINLQTDLFAFITLQNPAQINRT